MPVKGATRKRAHAVEPKKALPNKQQHEPPALRSTHQSAFATVVLSQKEAKLALAAIAVIDSLVVLPGDVLLLRLLRVETKTKTKKAELEADTQWRDPRRARPTHLLKLGCSGP